MISFIGSPLSRILEEAKQVLKPLVPSPNKKCDQFGVGGGNVAMVDLQSNVTLGSSGFVLLTYAPCQTLPDVPG